jgi:hypothetical protein
MGINEVSEVLRIVTVIGRIAVRNGKDSPPACGAKVGTEYQPHFSSAFGWSSREEETPHEISVMVAEILDLSPRLAYLKISILSSDQCLLA